MQSWRSLVRLTTPSTEVGTPMTDPYGNQPERQPNYDPNALPPAPPSYGQPVPANYAPYAQMGNPFESEGTKIMILGILSLVVCGLLGPVAWVMGNGLKSKSEAAGYPEPGNAKAGRICGMIGSGLMVVGIIFYAIFFIALASNN